MQETGRRRYREHLGKEEDKGQEQVRPDPFNDERLDSAAERRQQLTPPTPSPREIDPEGTGLTQATDRAALGVFAGEASGEKLRYRILDVAG